MTAPRSPLNPRVEVRFVGDGELEAMIEALVVPDTPGAPNYFRADALMWRIVDEFGVHADPVRINLVLCRLYPSARFLEPRRAWGVPHSTYFAGCFAEDITGHQRLHITRARREDDAAAAQPRPYPIPAPPTESLSAMIDRLLG